MRRIGPSRREARRWATFGLCCIAAVSGCGGSQLPSRRTGFEAQGACRRTDELTERSLGADASVRRIQITFVDSRRPTRTESPPEPCRVLRTDIRVPLHRSGPLPLIVVAHGFDGDPSSLAPLLDAWAQHGYVVAAPRLPTTEKDEEGSSTRRESVEQARDLSFVISRLVDASAQGRGHALSNSIDPRRIGAAGMSLGGLAVYGLISNTCCRDARVRAAVLMAAVRRQFPDDHYGPNHAPVLLVQGDKDGGYHNSVDAYPELAPPKWFITLHGSGHASPFEVPPGPEAPLVATTTGDFWDRYLGDRHEAATNIVRAVRASQGRAGLQFDAAAR